MQPKNVKINFFKLYFRNFFLCEHKTRYFLLIIPKNYSEIFKQLKQILN